MSLTKPTIHQNGTSAESLMAGYMMANDTLAKVFGALSRTAPNERDYYPQGDGAFERAQAEHFARVAHLATVRDELAALWDHARRAEKV